MKFSDFFLDILKTQLLAKQVMSQEDWEAIEQKITFVFSTDSYFTESKQAEIMKDRLAMLRDAADFVGRYYSERWVRKNILRQTEDDIDEMNAEIEVDRQKELERQQQEMAMQAEQQAQMQQQQQGAPAEGQEQTPTGEATATSSTLGEIVFDASSLL
jgi:TolA-binding protein